MKIYKLTLLLFFPSLFSCDHAVEVPEAIQANFSGEWKSKESISMGGNIVCCYNSGDRMLAETIKIAEQADFLTIEASSSFPGTAPVTSQEKLTFDGKEIQVNRGRERGKKFTVKLSADGQTMTINSTVHLAVATPFNVDVQQQGLVYVTEVWKLSDDGKSITVQASAKANLFGDERAWKTVFYKTN